MKSRNISRIGGIFFFIGLSLLFLSWHLTYPIYIPESNEITFTQFYPSIWPGIILSLIGLFLVGYYSKSKSVKAVCASIFPIILYVYAFYFSYVASSDSGSVNAMFEIFHQTGINSAAVPYFQYPIYFTLNEITSQIIGLNVNSLAITFFTLFGILLGLYLFLFFLKMIKKNAYKIAFLAVPLYFTNIFSYLNYQWVPQTLALVFFFLLLVLLDKKETEYKLLSIIIFTTLVFTHAFIPVIFLLFFGLYTLKNKRCMKIFLIMFCIYASVLIYYTTFYLPIIAETFMDAIYGPGGEYSSTISNSFREAPSFMSQIISMINRLRIPLALLIVSIGAFIEFIKKRMSFTAIALAATGGFYLGLGLFYSILGMRALQILFIPLMIGISFFILKWRKLAFAFVVIILILSVFGPMRGVYDQYQFQIDEERNACNFLVNAIPIEQQNHVAMGALNAGYFDKKYSFVNMNKTDYLYLKSFKPNSLEFYHVFNISMGNNDYILYNENLEKEIILSGIGIEKIHSLKEENLLNNKIYQCGKTYIVSGD